MHNPVQLPRTPELVIVMYARQENGTNLEIGDIGPSCNHDAHCLCTERKIDLPLVASEPTKHTGI